MTLRRLLAIAVEALFLLAAATFGRETIASDHANAPPSAESDELAESKDELRGVPLGEYRIRSYYPVDAQKSTVRFSLYAAVKGQHLSDAQRLVEQHRQKLRDQVITATRLAPLDVFQEPELSVFRRRILVRLRRAIPDLVIEDLYVSEFDLVIKSL
jgi:hypothetical protein